MNQPDQQPVENQQENKKENQDPVTDTNQDIPKKNADDSQTAAPKDLSDEAPDQKMADAETPKDSGQIMGDMEEQAGAEKSEIKEDKEEAEASEEKSAGTTTSTTSGESSEGQQTEARKDDSVSDVEDEDEEDEDEHEEEQEEIKQEDFEKMSMEELVVLLDETVREGEVSAIKRKVALIKVAFLKKLKDHQEARYEQYIQDGGKDEDFEKKEDEEETRFNEIFQIYKDKKSAFIAEQEEIKKKNLQTKHEILEQLRELIESEETLKKTYDDFKELQEKWRDVGMVPKNEISNLWNNYHFLVEKFFDKVKINKELRDLDLKKNLEAKINLCEKAEELLLEKSIIKSFRELQKLHDEYKNVGPVPRDKKDEIWDRFKAATDKINERRREHYAKRREEQENNYDAKQALCEKAEIIVGDKIDSIKEWQEKTGQINELLKIWKTLGPAPRKVNDEIWARFKTLLDSFFSAKKDFFNELKEQQMENYNKKVDICVQAEGMQDSNDWKNTTRELINLQKEWKNIGPVPRKYSDKIWKRFRAACDHFFNKKQDYFANLKSHEEENLKKKKELIEKIQGYEFSEDKNANLRVIKDFQREWTEIGHVPIKEKDKIYTEFRNAINKQLDKLDISKVEVDTMQFKNKVENLKEQPNASRKLNSEKNFLRNKITKMTEDINLWENNIGFLADSKNAQLLKKEFDEKIRKAKQEIALLKAKLKVLNEAK